MFSIRTAKKKDSQLIHNLASRVWSNTYAKILPKEQLDYMFEMMYAPENIISQMTQLKHQYFIVSKDSVPCGYLSIEKKSDNTYIFQKIYILPEMQGTGLGRYLIEQGISYIKSIHPTPFTVILYVNRENPAVGFYKHVGFYVLDTRDQDIGNGFYMNDYIMAMNVE